jgi:predicted nucleic-acid-binding Zn-ribbon protein
MEAQEQRKIMRKKCPRCRRLDYWRETPIAMSRLYVKRKIGGRWRWYEVGWICLRCGYVEIEHSQLPKIKTYKSYITTDYDYEPESEEAEDLLEKCPTCGEPLRDRHERREVTLRWKAIIEAYKSGLEGRHGPSLC